MHISAAIIYSVYFFKLEKLEKIVIVPKIGLEEQKAGLIESRR